MILFLKKQKLQEGNMQSNNVNQYFDEKNQPVYGTSDLNCSEETKEQDNQTIEFQDIEMQRIEEPLNERIVDRIANNYALLLIKNKPEANRHFKHPTTIITPEGAFQWNPEIEQWTRRIDVENFNTDHQEIDFLLKLATEIRHGSNTANTLALPRGL